MDLIENVGRRSRVGGDQGDFIDVGVFSVNGFERNALFRNLGTGRFVDVAWPEGADLVEDARGLGILDLEGDGDLDLVLNNYLQPARLLVNHASPSNHWFELRLEGTRSNRSAIGARVVIEHGARRQTRWVTSTAGYLSGTSLALHFGLGADREIDRLRVYWPSGEESEFLGVAADREWRLREGAPELRPAREHFEAPPGLPEPRETEPRETEPIDIVPASARVGDESPNESPTSRERELIGREPVAP